MRPPGGLVAILLVLAGGPARALELQGNFVQGGLVLGQTEPGARVSLAGHPVRVAPDGRFVFGFGRDHGPEATLTVRLPGGGETQRSLAIAPRHYRIQRIDGLPPGKVTPNPADLARIRRENAEIARIRALDTPEPLFESGWIWPARGVISGVFGSQRVLNGKPRRPHYGVDIAAPIGTPVRAPADGIVRLAAPDLFYTGNTLMLDHGFGLVSVYSHLSALEVAVGDRVTQGTLIGRIGATGRVTGAHLDWRLNWFGERLDPALLVGPMPAAPD